MSAFMDIQCLGCDTISLQMVSTRLLSTRHNKGTHPLVDSNGYLEKCKHGYEFMQCNLFIVHELELSQSMIQAHLTIPPLYVCCGPSHHNYSTLNGRRLSLTNLSLENNFSTFRLNAPVIIREVHYHAIERKAVHK